MAGQARKADAPAKPQPHRFRVSVPAADEAVVAWMELQDNPSLSVRMLIRESIERQGYIDIVNRPVSQLPRRDRPAESSEEGRAAEESGAAAAGARPHLPTSAPEPEPREAAAESPQRPQEAASAPALPDAGEPAGAPLDVNDIFSMTR